MRKRRDRSRICHGHVACGLMIRFEVDAVVLLDSQDGMATDEIRALWDAIDRTGCDRVRAICRMIGRVAPGRRRAGVLTDEFTPRRGTQRNLLRVGSIRSLRRLPLLWLAADPGLPSVRRGRPAYGLPDFSAAIRTFVDEIDLGHAPVRLDVTHIHGQQPKAAGTEDRSHLNVVMLNICWHYGSPQ